MRKRLWLLAGVVLLIGAFTVTGATAKSAKISGAAAKTTLVFGAEQDVNGFNTNLEASNQFWGVVIGNSAVIRGHSVAVTRTRSHSSSDCHAS